MIAKINKEALLHWWRWRHFPQVLHFNSLLRYPQPPKCVNLYTFFLHYTFSARLNAWPLLLRQYISTEVKECSAGRNVHLLWTTTVVRLETRLAAPTLAMFSQWSRSSMAAVALRSCRRGLSQILSNGGLAALSSKRLEGLLRCPLMAGTFGNARVPYRGI